MVQRQFSVGCSGIDGVAFDLCPMLKAAMDAGHHVSVFVLLFIVFGKFIVIFVYRQRHNRTRRYDVLIRQD
jgi:hypothetical protein